MLILESGHLGATFFCMDLEYVYDLLDEHQDHYHENGLDGRSTFVCRVSRGCPFHVQLMLNSN